MLVKMYGIFKEELETSFELQSTDLRQLLSELTYRLGDERTQILYKTPMYYVLGKRTSDELLVLNPELPIFEFGQYDILHLIPEVSGDIPVAFVAIALSAIGASSVAASTIALYAITALANTVLMVAVGAVVQLLSPTPEFSSDPAQAQLQKSSLFNGVRQTNEQGGPVPLVYGQPFMSGVPISIGLYNEQYTPD